MNGKRSKNRLFNTIIISAGFFSISPVVIALIYQFFMQVKGIEINEANSGVFSSFWLFIITLPVGIILMVFFAIIKDRYNNK